MVTVEVTPEVEGWRCAVEVAEGGAKSRHTVRLRAADLERWGRQGETADQLVARAFTFLLAREPASHILRSFDLRDISRYFPEFDTEIQSC